MKGQDLNENKSGNVPIPLKNSNDQKNQDDILDDYLREQKRAEKMNKLEQMEQQLMDQHIQAEKKKFFDRYMKQNKDKQLAYDFDGNFVVQNRKAQPIKHQSNQPDGLNVKVNFNVSNKQQVIKKNQQQKQIPERVKEIRLKNNNYDDEDYKKQNIETKLPANINQNQYQDIVNNIQLSKGVKMIGYQGDIKQNINSSSQRNMISTNEQNPKTLQTDIKKMTKKEYEQMVQNGNNFIRNDYKFNRNTQINSSQQKQTYQNYQQKQNLENQNKINKTSVLRNQAQNSLNQNFDQNEFQQIDKCLQQNTMNSIDMEGNDILKNSNAYQSKKKLNNNDQIGYSQKDYDMSLKNFNKNKCANGIQKQQNTHGSIKVVDQAKLNLLLG